jgi:hypothetical protein
MLQFSTSDVASCVHATSANILGGTEEEGSDELALNRAVAFPIRSVIDALHMRVAFFNLGDETKSDRRCGAIVEPSE